MAIDKSSYEYQEFMKLAHRADQRLLRLERLEREAYYSSVTEYAYKGAQRSISDLGGGRRFRSLKIESEDDLMKARASVTQFLKAPSSTKRGITSVYKKRAESFNATMRAQDSSWQDMTWQELADAWDYIENTKDGKFGYRSIMKAFNKVKQYGPKEAAKELKAGSNIVKRIASNKVEEAVLENIIKDVVKIAVKAII